MANKIQSTESILLSMLKPGKMFFTTKTDKDMAALSVYYNRKIKTERLMAVNPRTGETERITKIVIVK